MEKGRESKEEEIREIMYKNLYGRKEES